jgi:hypothetical protein
MSFKLSHEGNTSLYIGNKTFQKLIKVKDILKIKKMPLKIFNSCLSKR